MDRRREARRVTQARVEIRVGGRTVQCLMRNLSRSGCMVVNVGLLAEIGAPLEVWLEPGVEVPGSVAWQLGECIGVSFDQPVKETIIERLSGPSGANA